MWATRLWDVIPRVASMYTYCLHTLEKCVMRDALRGLCHVDLVRNVVGRLLNDVLHTPKKNLTRRIAFRRCFGCLCIYYMTEYS